MAALVEKMAKRKPPNRDPFHEKLGRLIELYASRSRTLADIARSAGMSRQQLNELLSGKVKHPRLDTLQAILDAIGATLSDYDRV